MQFINHRVSTAARAALVVAATLGSVAYAGAEGGSSVRNGAGLVEQNFTYAYQSLPKAIASCQASPACGNRAADQAVMRAVLEVLRQAQSSYREEGILDFISGQANPGFFDTAPGQSHRVARTELAPGATVYINVDQLYLADGNPALDLGAITAILFHEFGHQAGYSDHQQLDRIGARIRGSLADRTMRYGSSIGSMPLEMTVINYGGYGAPTDLFFRVGFPGKEEVTALGYLLLGREVRCQQGRLASPLGWRFENGHWGRVQPGAIMPFQGWLVADCLSATGDLFPERWDVEISIDLDADENGRPRFTGATVVFGALEPTH